MAPAYWAPLGLFALFAVAGAAWDVRFRRIPNVLNLLFLLTGIATAYLFVDAAAALSSLAHAIIALCVGMALFAVRAWGGGDAKFYAATAAWFELDEIFRLVLAISAAGLALVIIAYVSHRLRRRDKARFLSTALPYGAAIAAGGAVLMAT